MTAGASRLNIGPYRRAWWRREGVWQGAGLAGAGALLAGALVVAIAPLGPMPEPRPSAPLDPLALHVPSRPSAPAEALAAIADANLFTPSRRDWEVARAPVEEADANAQREQAEARRKQALEDLSRLVFVATLRSGEEWTALAETPERRPGDDLLTLRVGGEYKGWIVGEIGRDYLLARFDGEEHRLDLRPRVTTRPTAAPEKTGRSVVEVRPGPVRPVIVDPPIGLEEAGRRLRDAARDEDERVRKMVDELLESLKNERPAAGKQEKRT